MSQPSRREQLLKVARGMNLKVSPAISDNDLENLINEQPATAKQMKLIAEALRAQGRRAPGGLSYGDARQAIASINAYAIEVLSIGENQVWRWRDKYYIVALVLHDNHLNMVLLEQVTLYPGKNGAKTKMKSAGMTIRAHPYNMLQQSKLIDLDTWPS